MIVPLDGSGNPDENNFALGSIFSGSALGTGDSGVNANFNVIRFANPHNFKDGEAVSYHLGTGATTVGLSTTPGTLYYVDVIDDCTIRLVTSADRATNPTAYQKGFNPDDVSGNTITITGHGFTDGQSVRYDAPDPKGFLNVNVNVEYKGANDDGTAKFENKPDANNSTSPTTSSSARSTASWTATRCSTTSRRARRSADSSTAEPTGS